MITILIQCYIFSHEKWYHRLQETTDKAPRQLAAQFPGRLCLFLLVCHRSKGCTGVKSMRKAVPFYKSSRL